MINFEPIGKINTPFKDLQGMPIQPSGAKDVEGTIELNPKFEQGLDDLDGFSHIILLYHFHLSKDYDLSVTPFLDKTRRGLFSTRAPRRPNAIGLSIVRLVERQGSCLKIKDIDVLDGTPLIDIKPYVPRFDTKENVRSGWLENTQQKSTQMKSDDRFVES